jgi:glycosyltransferase involved in cell wall biosynthesis
VEICQSYANRFPDKIEIAHDSSGNLGVVGNFERLLLTSSASYVMFSDQDDIWLPEKIELELREIQKLEGNYGATLPFALFTDALVVNSEIRPISNSLLRYINRQRSQEANLRRLCIEPNCYGCTMILNRALINRIKPFPAEVISHDWWCGMIAASLGKLIFVDCAPIKHRRHGSNQSATKESSLLRYAREKPSLDRHRIWVRRVLTQAEVFARQYEVPLRSSNRNLWNALIQIRRSFWMKRRWLLAMNGIKMTGWTRNLALWLVV